MEGIAAKYTEFDEPLKTHPLDVGRSKRGQQDHLLLWVVTSRGKHALQGKFSFVWRSLSKDKEIKEKVEGRRAGGEGTSGD